MPYSLGCPASRRSSQSPPQSAPPSCRTPPPSPQFRCPSAAGCGRTSSSSSLVSLVYTKTPDMPHQTALVFASLESPASCAALCRFISGSGRHVHCTVHIKGTHREIQDTSTSETILPWTKVPMCGGWGMGHAVREHMAQMCHTLWRVRVYKALGEGGGRTWSTPPHL